MMVRLLIIMGVVLFISCDPMDDRMVIKNNSTENIYIRVFIKKGLDVEETMIGIRGVLPNKSKRLGMISNWDSEFKDLNSDTLLLIIYKDYPFLHSKEELSSKIKSDSLLFIGEYKYKKFTYDDLKKNKWSIEYPAKEFIKGDKYLFKHLNH